MNSVSAVAFPPVLNAEPGVAGTGGRAFFNRHGIIIVRNVTQGSDSFGFGITALIGVGGRFLS